MLFFLIVVGATTGRPLHRAILSSRIIRGKRRFPIRAHTRVRPYRVWENSRATYHYQPLTTNH